MSSPPEFTMRIARKTQPLEEGAGIMTIVVQRPYAHLERELRNAFKGQEDVKVILDRRCGERRKRPKAVAVDRRKSDRRSPKKDMVEVVIST
jgi:hypothetical protein